MNTKLPQKNINIQKQKEIMDRLRNAGIQVELGEKEPKNGQYSGIIGARKGERILNI